MKRSVLLAVLMTVAMLSPVLAVEYRGIKINPNDHVLISLLTMVVTDLEMCGRSLVPTVRDEISAIGHLNNAQSALKKAALDPAYGPLIEEILDRIGKVKFYLLMQDFNAVTMRLSQLIGLIRSLLGVQGGSYYNPYNPYNPNYGGGSNSGNQFVPTRPTEIPVGGGGQGQGIPVPSTAVPGVPVN
ncbi:MAG: hypothetical protein OZSIB_4309 [Candidatus Ozemobacter sibiricus]|jgi:hypothetical protein|uniref:Uncharacterized protein n=1 Tax=Candidatus Ozemobacter sibiricus TaxID=2268124 RepID=A0A367ZN51_9BACT|nr:MAG: hypothetical protein OZSIB_4309 [Candidatus Ozemobacter sibiricus]